MWGLIPWCRAQGRFFFFFSWEKRLNGFIHSNVNKNITCYYSTLLYFRNNKLPQTTLWRIISLGFFPMVVLTSGYKGYKEGWIKLINWPTNQNKDIQRFWVHYEMHLVLCELWSVPLIHSHFFHGWEVYPTIILGFAEVPGGRGWQDLPVHLDKGRVSLCSLEQMALHKLFRTAHLWFPAQITELETCLSTEMLTLDSSQLSLCLYISPPFWCFPLKWGFLVAWYLKQMDW